MYKPFPEKRFQTGQKSSDSPGGELEYKYTIPFAEDGSHLREKIFFPIFDPGFYPGPDRKRPGAFIPVKCGYPCQFKARLLKILNAVKVNLPDTKPKAKR